MILKKFNSYNPKIYQWIFIGLLALVSFSYSYDEIVDMRPASIHQWRQCDALSFTLNYYMEDSDFLESGVHRIGKNGNGKAISEFPIIYYTVAKLWKLFGYHEYLFRLIDALFLFFALFLLFKFCEDILKNSVWAILITLFFFTSPILVYYGNNFMTDVPALSSAIIGWFFFWQFYKTGKNKWLFISVLFFTLGMLLKASAGISFVCAGILFLFEFFNLTKFKKGEKIFKQPWKQSLFFIIPFILIFLWYVHASRYNKENNPGLFLLGLKPIWELGQEQIDETRRSLFHELLPQYFNPNMFVVILLMFALLLLFRKKVNTILFIATVATFVGTITFLLLFYQLFDVHDYHLTNLLIFVLFVLITFFFFIKQNYPELLNNYRFKILFTVLLYYCIYNTSVLQKVKYFGESSTLLDRKQVEYWKWYHWNYKLQHKAQESITPYLRSIGINRTDYVYSTPDYSPNISLSLMDQKGWTDFGQDEFGSTKDDFMKKIITLGAKYLIVNDSTKLKEDYLQPYIKKPIGKYKNIDIFDLRSTDSLNSVNKTLMEE